MGCHISQLPDEILCNILSLLTVRDSVRTKSLVNPWRCLPDIRSVLEFDAFNVFGKEKKFCFLNEFHRSEFVSAVDKFMELWRGTKVNRLSVDFALGNEHASHIDRWILTALRMGVEDIHLNFIHTDHESYHFPSRLEEFEKYSSSLKCLCLRKCKLHFYSGCEIWLSCLTVLELNCVPLNWYSVRFILSGGLILTSLTLSDCSLPSVFRIDGTQLNCLKKLAIKERVMKIELNCENLESFKYYGESGDITFAYVPILREVDVWLKFGLSASGIFDNLMRNAPQLEALSLCMMIDVVKPLSSANIAKPCLKKLDLHAKIPSGFNLLRINYLLEVYPFLEILHLKLSLCGHTVPMQGRGHRRNLSHSRLKEVKIEGFSLQLSSLTFICNLLQNAVALQYMIIKTLNGCPIRKQRLTEVMRKVIAESTAEVVRPQSSANIAKSCLRKLDVHAKVPLGFNLSSINYLLKVYPFLEILHLKLSLREHMILRQGGGYCGNLSHSRLKEVEIEGFSLHGSSLMFICDLLKNAVALQYMIIKTLNGCPNRKERLTTVLQKVIAASTAEVII